MEGLLQTLFVGQRKAKANCARHLVMHKGGRRLGSFYEVGDQLGEGGFGIVKKARMMYSERDCVVKFVQKDKVSDFTALEREVLIHGELDHPNVVKIFESFTDSVSICIVMELCAGGDLADCVEELGGCGDADALSVSAQVLRAVHYMHSKGLVHRDIKLENFLLKERGIPLSENTVKLTDFGFATRFQLGAASLQTICGTPHYMAPEVFSRKPYTEKCDMWSCGVAMYALVCGDVPFDGDNVMAIIRMANNAAIVFHGARWRAARESTKAMVEMLCERDPRRRISAEQALTYLMPHGAVGDSQAGAGSAGTLTDEMVTNLQHFSSLGNLQQESLHRVAYHLDDAELTKIRTAFLQADTNGDGRLTREELRSFFAKMFVQCPEVDEIFSAADLDGSGTIEYSEFVAATMSRSKAFPEDACWAAFRSFDTDCSGSISSQEISAALCSNAGSRLNIENAEFLMNEVDSDRDGQLDFHEFKALLRRRAPVNLGAVPAATAGGA